MEGDVLSKMRLDIADVFHKLNQVEKAMKVSMTKVEQRSALSSQRMAKDSQNFMHVSRGHAKTFSADWFKRFGEVAIGFTLAYRAMNAFETGLVKVIETVKEGIMESSALAAVQAKLAFWYTMYAKESVTYAEAFKNAAVNIRALGLASIQSISTIDELTTGLDEMAQSVGAIPAEMIPAMASMVDFTVMVAKTTGSSTRQVRQEFQALMEGRIRTTDVMARSLIKTGIMTRAELKQMRNMTNQAEILNRVMTAVHEKWSVARDTMRRASIEMALPFWEKTLRANIRYAVDFASAMGNIGKKTEETGNIFAIIFVKHAQKILEDLTKGIGNNVLMIKALAAGLDFSLTFFENALSVTSKFVATLYNLSDELFMVLKVFGGYIILGPITKMVEGLGKMFLWLAVGPLFAVRRAFIMLNSSILAIPAAIYLTAMSFFALIKTLGGNLDMMIKDLKNFFMEIPAYLSWVVSSIWDKIPGPIKKVLDYVTNLLSSAWNDAKNLAKSAAPKITNFFSSWGSNIKNIFLGHVETLEGLLKPMWARITKGNDESFKQMLKDTEKHLEGLKWQFEEAGAEGEKERKARLQREKRILSLMKQMQKDSASSRLEALKKSLDNEFQMRMLKIRSLTKTGAAHDKQAWDLYLKMRKERLKTRNELEGQALLAYTTKSQQAVFDKMKFYTKSYYDWKRSQLLADKKQLEALGVSSLETKKFLLDEEKRLDIEKNQHLLETTDDFIEAGESAWRNYILNAKSAQQEVAELSLQITESFAQGVSNAFARVYIYGESLLANLKSLAQEIAATIISTLIRIGIEKSIQWLMYKALDATEAISRMSTLAMETYAGAFASTVAIPAVGPAMAPAVASASLAAMLSGSALAKVAGAAVGAPSFDEGGISRTPGLYYAGIPEIHIPLKDIKSQRELKEPEKPTEVNILNVFDPIMLDQYLSSARGQDAIINIIGNRSQSVLRVLR